MKTAVLVLLAALALAGSYLLGRRSVKPEIVEIHRTDTVVVRDTVRETVLVPKVRYLTRVDTVLLLVPGDTSRFRYWSRFPEMCMKGKITGPSCPASAHRSIRSTFSEKRRP